jgi:hypothetical protein
VEEEAAAVVAIAQIVAAGAAVAGGETDISEKHSQDNLIESRRQVAAFRAQFLFKTLPPRQGWPLVCEVRS